MFVGVGGEREGGEEGRRNGERGRGEGEGGEGGDERRAGGARGRRGLEISLCRVKALWLSHVWCTGSP